MGPFMMCAFVMGSLVMGPSVGVLLKHALSITNKKIGNKNTCYVKYQKRPPPPP
jgi:hypothetical protein